MSHILPAPWKMMIAIAALQKGLMKAVGIYCARFAVLRQFVNVTGHGNVIRKKAFNFMQLFFYIWESLALKNLKVWLYVCFGIKSGIDLPMKTRLLPKNAG